MQKFNTAHVTEINIIMLQTIASYINFITDDDNDMEYVHIYTTDVAYNTAALHVFNNDKNAQTLHNSIMQQDTFVREYFIKVLRYIEENNLISKHKFCCI